MARILDDIVHYFRENGGVDLLKASASNAMLRDNWSKILYQPSITTRQYPVSVACTLAEELVAAEQALQEAEKELRELRTLMRRVLDSGIVEWVLNRGRGQLWEED